MDEQIARLEEILTPAKNATQEDFGVYTCTMENNLGSDKKDILLIDKGINFNEKF